MNNYHVGDLVLVTPEENDIFQNEFAGIIVDFRGESLISVEDGDGDVFDAYESQLEMLEKFDLSGEE